MFSRLSQGVAEVPMKSSRRRAVSLVELLVVLAIIGLMIGLLLPALQSSREAARNSACRNNLRQMSIAAQNHTELGNDFPVNGESWTITLLQWIEDRSLMKLIKQGNVSAAIGHRPQIYRCPSQPDPSVDKTGVTASHYTLEVCRDSNRRRSPSSVFRDRIHMFSGEKLLPWYEGPVAGQQTSKSDTESRGPHRGLFNRN